MMGAPGCAKQPRRALLPAREETDIVSQSKHRVWTPMELMCTPWVLLVGKDRWVLEMMLHSVTAKSSAKSMRSHILLSDPRRW